MLETAIPQDVLIRVEHRLKALEDKHNIRILLAMETGSRAWEFASTDSDYDVRFIYAHRQDWYLSIKESGDNIDIPITDDLDITGWDLRKALRLLMKSNPVLSEWLASPYIYTEQGRFASRLRELARKYYSPKASAYHYLHMAETVFKSSIAERPMIPRKKYFYVLRPLLVIRWIQQNDALPPISFIETYKSAKLSPATELAIDQLVELKKSGIEMAPNDRIPILDQLIDALIDEARAYCPVASSNRPPLKEVDQLFREILKEWQTA